MDYFSLYGLRIGYLGKSFSCTSPYAAELQPFISTTFCPFCLLVFVVSLCFCFDFVGFFGFVLYFLHLILDFFWNSFLIQCNQGEERKREEREERNRAESQWCLQILFFPLLTLLFTTNNLLEEDFCKAYRSQYRASLSGSYLSKKKYKSKIEDLDSVVIIQESGPIWVWIQ